VKKFIPEIKMLYGDVPCWYELSWDSENKNVIFRIHRDVLHENHLIISNSLMAKSLARTIRNPYFEGNLYKNFGFGGFWKDVVNNGFNDDFLEIAFKIPSYTAVDCLYCYEKDDKCKFHQADNEFSFRRAYNVSASWTILCSFLAFSVIKTGCDKMQLMTVSPIVKMGMHGGSLSCTLSKKVVDWLKEVQEDECELVEVVEAMKKAYATMFGHAKYDHAFYARVQKGGRLIMQCPGDACDLGPEDYVRKNGGYRLWPHNIDTAFQQITFFAGLAALHDIIRNKSN